MAKKPKGGIYPMGVNPNPQARKAGESGGDYIRRMEKFHSAELRKRAAAAEEKRKKQTAAEEKARLKFEEGQSRYAAYKERRKLNPNNPENKKR
jgi:negative regulator of replication initiation